MRECGTMRATVRQYTHTGRPLGSEEFVANLEHSTLRALAPRKAGRPTTRVRDVKQDGFIFAAWTRENGNLPPVLRFLNSRRKRREISMAKLSCSHMGRRNGGTPVCPDIPRSSPHSTIIPTPAGDARS